MGSGVRCSHSVHFTCTKGATNHFRFSLPCTTITTIAANNECLLKWRLLLNILIKLHCTHQGCHGTHTFRTQKHIQCLTIKLRILKQHFKPALYRSFSRFSSFAVSFTLFFCSCHKPIRTYTYLYAKTNTKNKSTSAKSLRNENMNHLLTVRELMILKQREKRFDRLFLWTCLI